PTTQSNVQAQRAGGDALNVQGRTVAQLHDRAFAELLLDLRQGILQFAVVRLVGHGSSSLAEQGMGQCASPPYPVVFDERKCTFVSIPNCAGKTRLAGAIPARRSRVRTEKIWWPS